MSTTRGSTKETSGQRESKFSLSVSTLPLQVNVSLLFVIVPIFSLLVLGMVVTKAHKQKMLDYCYIDFFLLFSNFLGHIES